MSVDIVLHIISTIITQLNFQVTVNFYSEWDCFENNH